MKFYIDTRFYSIPHLLHWRSCLESHSLWCEVLTYFSAVSQHSLHSESNACFIFDHPPLAAALWYALCQLSLEWPLIITELQALMSLWVGVCLCVCSNTLHNQVNTLQHVVAILIKELCCWLFACVCVCGHAYVYTLFACLCACLCVCVAHKS